MPEAVVNGFRIHYDRRGADAGAPVVFFHGAMAAHRAFAGQFPVVAPHHSVYAWDARGHGASTRFGEPGNPWSMLEPARFVEDAVAFLEDVVREPAHVVGVSMGGMIGSRVAATRPDLLRSLTLVSTASEQDPRYLDYFGRDPATALTPMEQRLFARWHGEPYWRDLARALFAYFSEPRPERFAGPEAGAFRGPVLLAFALDDALLGPHHVENWRRWLPQARTLVLPTGGHAFFADGRGGTRAFNAALREFLAEADGVRGPA